MYFQVCELSFRPHPETLALSVDTRFYVDIRDGANLTLAITLRLCSRHHNNGGSANIQEQIQFSVTLW